MIDTNEIHSEADSTTSFPFSNFDAQLPHHVTEYVSNIPSADYEVDAGGEWDLSGAFVSGLNENPELEETVISSIRRIERYLGDLGYTNPHFIGELEYYQEDGISPDYRLRVIIDISDAAEWLEIEDTVQEIAVESEVGDAELYVVVDRKRA